MNRNVINVFCDCFARKWIAGRDKQPSAWAGVGARCQLAWLPAAVPTAGAITCWQRILSSPGSCPWANPADWVCHVPTDCFLSFAWSHLLLCSLRPTPSDPAFFFMSFWHVCRFAPEHMNNFMPTWLPWIWIRKEGNKKHMRLPPRRRVIF